MQYIMEDPTCHLYFLGIHTSLQVGCGIFMVYTSKALHNQCISTGMPRQDKNGIYKTRSLRTFSALAFFDLRDIWQLVLPLVGVYSLSLSSFFESAAFCRQKNNFITHKECRRCSHLLIFICPSWDKQHCHYILWQTWLKVVQRIIYNHQSPQRLFV